MAGKFEFQIVVSIKIFNVKICNLLVESYLVVTSTILFRRQSMKINFNQMKIL